MIQHIQTDRFDCWFSIATVHGIRLEYVLADAEDRTGKERGHYRGKLWKMLDAALLESSVSAEAIEQSSYGYESFCVTTNSPEDLQQALAVCALTVRDWKRKYRVDQMKVAR